LNVDLIVASSIFIIFISTVFFYLFGFQKQAPSWQSVIELRKKATDLMDEIIAQGKPENWEKENILPSKIGLASSAYLIPILISDESEYNRVNEPIAQEIIFDESCNNIAWNGSVRIYDENFNEIPFRFVNQTFCPSGFLQKAVLFFEINVSANSTRKLQIFFHNSTQVKPKNYGNFSSLVLWLTFDEGSGNIAYDYSGNGNNGTLLDANTTNADGDTPPLWVNGKIGKALQFDGVDDYVDIPNSPSLQLTDTFTLLAWLRFSPGIVTGKGVVQKYPSSSPNDYDYMFYLSVAGYPFIYFKNPAGTAYSSGFYLNIRDDNWHFWVGTFDGRYLKMFVDGVLRNVTDTGGTTVRVSSQPLHIMHGWNGYLNGTADEIRIYNRALSEEEIVSHYQQPLLVKVFPKREVSLISFEKIEALRNISYDLLKEASQKNYEFRVEIYEK